MPQGFDLATTFVHLADGGGAEPSRAAPGTAW
jgi:hypothetical protein